MTVVTIWSWPSATGVGELEKLLREWLLEDLETFAVLFRLASLTSLWLEMKAECFRFLESKELDGRSSSSPVSPRELSEAC